jgi:hypothetical protein
MVMGNTFSSWEPDSPIKLVILNEEPLMVVEMCLWEQGHIYT